MKNGDTPYVDRVLRDAQSYSQSLLLENERLRASNIALESERDRIVSELEEARYLVTQNEALRTLVETFEIEKRRLAAHLERADSQLIRLRKEQEDMQRRLSVMTEESHRFSDQYLQIEEQNAKLATLYVASYRLHSTLVRSEVLEAIQEIIVNLVGSEELAIFERDAQSGGLIPIASFGVSLERLTRIPANGLIRRVADSGQLYVSDGRPALVDDAERDLTACIPLLIEGRVTAVIAIFRLLQQKPVLEAVDHEMFDLLATHAAMALHASTLHGQVVEVESV